MNLLCPKCGKRIQDDAKFCDGCGMRISHINGSRMNTRQRRILIAVAVMIAGMMLYPPFYYPRDPGRGEPVSHGYDWLLGHGTGRVEVELLLVQFLVVGVIGAIAYVLCADKKQ